MDKLIFLATAFYLRHTTIGKGRYRLLTFARPMGRKIGHSLGLHRIRTKHGFCMELDLSDWIPQDIYLTGEFESTTSTIVKRLLKLGDKAVDIGANIGWFTLLFAQCVGDTGQVYSFEPVPKLQTVLKKNLALNSFHQITLGNVALSDHNGQARFYVGPEDNTGLSSLRVPRGSTESFEVELRRFDDIFKEDSNIALVKIDVEGAELAVLRGMEDYLRAKHPYLLLEITDKFLREMGDDEHALLSFLQCLDYHCYVIGDAQLDLLDNHNHPPLGQWNALFAPTKVFGEKVVLDQRR